MSSDTLPPSAEPPARLAQRHAAVGTRQGLSRQRRGLLFLLACWPLAVQGGSDPTRGLKPWGSGEFRRFGFLIYEARLWAGEDPLQAPLALQLTYRRKISGSAITEASVKEIRQLGLTDEATLARWAESMLRLFPDVQSGDVIVGEFRPEGAFFHFNGQALGQIEEPAFARAFFAIWLDERTSAPDLRAALLRRSSGRD